MAPTRTQGWRKPEHLLGRSSEPIFAYRAPGKLCYVNPAWEILTGIPAARVLSPGRDDEVGKWSDWEIETLRTFEPPPETWDGQAVSIRALTGRPGGPTEWKRLDFFPQRETESGDVYVLGLVRPGESEPLVPEIQREKLREELIRIREEARERLGEESLVGRGPMHRRLLMQISAAGKSEAGVWIWGPPGTGKRHVARAIHRVGPGSLARFILLDCPALPIHLLENQLDRCLARSNWEERDDAPTDRLTLVLMGITSLPRDVQARLVESLRGGMNLERTRVIALDELDPEHALGQERVREDLCCELSALVLRLPPLCERREEIPLFAQDFLERSSKRKDISSRGFDSRAMDVLTSYDWPGNLRELKRVVDLAADRCVSPLIGVSDLSPEIRGELGAAYLVPSPGLPKTLDESLMAVERRLIERALRKSRNNKSKAARLLGISRPRLHRRIQDLGLEEGESPRAEPLQPGGAD